MSLLFVVNCTSDSNLNPINRLDAAEKAFYTELDCNTDDYQVALDRFVHRQFRAQELPEIGSDSYNDMLPPICEIILHNGQEPFKIQAKFNDSEVKFFATSDESYKFKLPPLEVGTYNLIIDAKDSNNGVYTDSYNFEYYWQNHEHGTLELESQVNNETLEVFFELTVNNDQITENPERSTSEPIQQGNIIEWTFGNGEKVEQLLPEGKSYSTLIRKFDLGAIHNVQVKSTGQKFGNFSTSQLIINLSDEGNFVFSNPELTNFGWQLTNVEVNPANFAPKPRGRIYEGVFSDIKYDQWNSYESQVTNNGYTITNEGGVGNETDNSSQISQEYYPPKLLKPEESNIFLVESSNRVYAGDGNSVKIKITSFNFLKDPVEIIIPPNSERYTSSIELDVLPPFSEEQTGIISVIDNDCANCQIVWTFSAVKLE